MATSSCGLDIVEITFIGSGPNEDNPTLLQVQVVAVFMVVPGTHPEVSLILHWPELGGGDGGGVGGGGGGGVGGGGVGGGGEGGGDPVPVPASTQVLVEAFHSWQITFW